MKRIIIIVDPQLDFISGALPVPGAEEAMNALAEYLRANNGAYAHKIVTVDWHPWFHSSFTDQGGPWPRHCVQYSQGAAIYQPVLSACAGTLGRNRVLTKGINGAPDEYSIFANSASASILDGLINTEDIAYIDICGIAGDVCVRSTVLDAARRYGASRIRVLQEFSPSLDGGALLASTVKSLKQQ